MKKQKALRFDAGTSVVWRRPGITDNEFGFLLGVPAVVFQDNGNEVVIYAASKDGVSVQRKVPKADIRAPKPTLDGGLAW